MTIAILIVSVLALAAAAAGLIVALGSRKQLSKLDPAALAETVAAETARRQAEAAEALRVFAPEFFRIGDCLNPDVLFGATSGGYFAGREI